MSDAETNLRNAIDESYEEFSGIPCPRTLETSPLRNGDEILRTLTSAPLRELSGEEIGPYSGWAITTVGNDRDYRHFLPRILELAVTDPGWVGTMPPVLAGKLNMGAWRNWPANQKFAIVRFFDAALDAMIERHPDDWPAEAADWFCAIATLGEPIAPVVERWRTSDQANAALNMAGFLNEQSHNLRKHGEVRGSFWKEVSEEVRREAAQLLFESRTMVFLCSAMDKVSEEDRFCHLDPAIAELAEQL